jgi:hypothetical protein
MAPDVDASEEDADAWDAREVVVVDDEHVSADVIVPALGGIGVPDTNAAVAAKEGVEARVHQEQQVMRRNWFRRTERRVIIGSRSWRAVCGAAESSEIFRRPSYTFFRGGWPTERQHEGVARNKAQATSSSSMATWPTESNLTVSPRHHFMDHRKSFTSLHCSRTCLPLKPPDTTSTTPCGRSRSI